MIGQTDDLAPADRRLYAIRDVTGSVESIPLLVSSILSKKVAEGLDGLVMDVKCGSGAFCDTEPMARDLAQSLVAVANQAGLPTVALITDGRFSGVSHGILIGHISPEAARGGPIAAVRDGDTIVIDPGARTLNLEVAEAEIARRMADWRAPETAGRVRPGSVHDKYIKLVSSAHYGCVV